MAEGKPRRATGPGRDEQSPPAVPSSLMDANRVVPRLQALRTLPGVSVPATGRRRRIRAHNPLKSTPRRAPRVLTDSQVLGAQGRPDPRRVKLPGPSGNALAEAKRQEGHAPREGWARGRSSSPATVGFAATALREQHRQTRCRTRGECSGRRKALKGGEPQERARLEHAGESRSDGNRPGRTNGAGGPPPRVEARWHRPGSGFGPAVRQCVDPPGWVVLKGPQGNLKRGASNAVLADAPRGLEADGQGPGNRSWSVRLRQTVPTVVVSLQGWSERPREACGCTSQWSLAGSRREDTRGRRREPTRSKVEPQTQ